MITGYEELEDHESHEKENSKKDIKINEAENV
jgi:hypothetical protein